MQTASHNETVAHQLMSASLVWDNLLPWGQDLNSLDADLILPRYREAGVDYISLSVAYGAADTATTLSQMGFVNAQIRDRFEYVVHAMTLDQIRDARASGKLAVGLNFQNTVPFGTDANNVEIFYNLGVRQAILAYNNSNFVGDGCAENRDAGLSLFGHRVIAEMNRVGMVVDCSHSGYRTSMEAIEVSTSPVVFSHSNPFEVVPHYRSVKDDQMRACAASGGVVGINGVGYWIGDLDAGTEAIFRCLDYAVELIGAEHVGLGFDYVRDFEQLHLWARSNPVLWPPYEGEWMPKHQYAGPEQIVELVAQMLDHGYPKDAVRAILGGNWMRIAESVWQ